jgi:hypothetical protein
VSLSREDSRPLRRICDRYEGPMPIRCALPRTRHTSAPTDDARCDRSFALDIEYTDGFGHDPRAYVGLAPPTPAGSRVGTRHAGFGLETAPRVGLSLRSEAFIP